jgi:hypothetical protein
MKEGLRGGWLVMKGFQPSLCPSLDKGGKLPFGHLYDLRFLNGSNYALLLIY